MFSLLQGQLNFLEFFGLHDSTNDPIYSITQTNDKLSIVRYFSVGRKIGETYTNEHHSDALPIATKLGVPITKVSECGKFRLGLSEFYLHVEAGKMTTLKTEYEVLGKL